LYGLSLPVSKHYQFTAKVQADWILCCSGFC